MVGRMVGRSVGRSGNFFLSTLRPSGLQTRATRRAPSLRSELPQKLFLHDFVVWNSPLFFTLKMIFAGIFCFSQNYCVLRKSPHFLYYSLCRCVGFSCMKLSLFFYLKNDLCWNCLCFSRSLWILNESPPSLQVSLNRQIFEGNTSKIIPLGVSAKPYG